MKTLQIIYKILKYVFKAVWNSTIFVTIIFLFFIQSRTYYKLSDDRDFTIWKYPNGVTYVIPGKCTALFPRTNECITTINNDSNSSIHLYYLNDSANTIVLGNERSLNRRYKWCYVNLDNKYSEWNVVEYSDYQDTLLFECKDGNMKLKDNVDEIHLELYWGTDVFYNNKEIEGERIYFF